MAIDPVQDVLGKTDSVAQLHEMLADSPLGFAHLDRELRYVHVNASIAAFHGNSISEHAGRPMEEIIGGVAFDAIKPYLLGALEGKHFEVSIDGSLLKNHRDRKQAVVYGYPARDASNAIVGVNLIAVDTTALRETEAKRTQIDSQLQLALDAAGMGLWRWTLERHAGVSWSRTAAKLLGIDPDLTPSSELLRKAIGEEQYETASTMINESVANGTPYEQEVSVVYDDNSIHWLLSKAQVSETADGQREMVGVLADITERRAHQVEDARNSARQARAGEQAVRMQRVTAALSQAVTVSQVCEVLLGEGASTLNAPRRIVALLDANGNGIESMQYEGYGQATPALATQKLDDEFPIPHCMRTGEVVLLNSQKEMLARFPSFEPILRNSQSQACAIIPLTKGNEVFGAWGLIFPYERTFEEGELIILLTLAAQGAAAIERARIYERERRISDSLQRTLLPQGLPSMNGLSAAVRYRPGAKGVKVGGDWYDVIRLGANRVGLVIGDVGGHNIDSASTMGQLRNAIRSYAWENHPAGRILELTNRLLYAMEPGKLATCCYVDLNLDDGIATLATAGHPPPLVISHESGPYFVELPPGTPLGTTPDQEYKQSTLFLSACDSIALYTDGLVESRSMGVQQGMQGLAVAAAENPGADTETLADVLMKANPNERQEDDMALLVATFEATKPIAPGSARRAIHRYLPSSAASAGVARRFAADVMQDWGALELVDQVELCVSELVTNALIHTAADVELVMRLTPTSVRVEVIDHSDRLPVMRSSSDEETSGRGLQIVEAVATAWGVEPAASGKSVWFQIQRPETN